MVTHLAKESIRVVDRFRILGVVLFSIYVRRRTTILPQETGRDVVGADLGNVSFGHLD
jgi:hypothetical protein